MAQVNFKFGDFCRLCLKQAEELVYLKATDTDSVSFEEKLTFINYILNPQNDVFPKWICLRCKKQLNFAYKFSKKCLKSLTVLNECLNQIQQNHFGDMKQFYITNIRNIQKNMPGDEDPLTIKDDELPSLEDDNSINFDDISISIKQEPDDIEINEHPIENEETLTSNLEESEEIPETPEETLDNIPIKAETSKIAEFTHEPNFNFAKVKVEPQFQEDVDMKRHFLTEPSPSNLLLPTDTIRNDTNRRKYTKKHPDTKPEKSVIFTCSICFRSYQSESLLTNHIATHENIHSCALCGKTFKVKEFFARHLESHLTDDDHHYICKVCGVKFTNVRKFRQHFAEHNKKYKNGQKLPPTKQMLEHACKKKKDEIFECNMCNDKFNQKRALIIHMRAHFD